MRTFFANGKSLARNGLFTLSRKRERAGRGPLLTPSCKHAPVAAAAAGAGASAGLFAAPLMGRFLRNGESCAPVRMQ